MKRRFATCRRVDAVGAESRALARFGVIAGAVSATALVLTASSLPTGLFQRIGLTVADTWIATSAVAIAAGRLVPAWAR